MLLGEFGRAHGLKGEVRSASGLTGGRARTLWQNGPRLLGARVTETLARAIATLEVNAAMGLIVAAPTAGAAGVLPAVLISMDDFAEMGEERLVDAVIRELRGKPFRHLRVVA